MLFKGHGGQAAATSRSKGNWDQYWDMGGFERWLFVQGYILNERKEGGRMGRLVPCCLSYVSESSSVSLSTFQAELEHFIPFFPPNYLLLCFGS